jgi:hypothetical protein
VWGLLPVAFAFLLFCEFNRNKRRVQNDLMFQASSVLKALLASHHIFSEDRRGGDRVRLLDDLERILAVNLIIDRHGFPMNVTPTNEELKLAPHDCADAMAERIIKTSGLSRIADAYVVKWLEGVVHDLWLTKQSARENKKKFKDASFPFEELQCFILTRFGYLIATCPESVKSFGSE